MEINRGTSNLITAYESNNNCEVFNYYLASKFKIKQSVKDRYLLKIVKKK